jgi:hypothetical protein
MNIAHSFELGGPGMIPTAIFGVLLVAAAVKYALSPEKRWVPLMLSLGLMTLFAGSLGFVTGMIKSCSAIGTAPPDERYVTVIGLGESLHNIALALVLCLLAAMATAVGALRNKSNQ